MSPACTCPAYRFPHRASSPDCHSGQHPLHWSTEHGGLSHPSTGDGLSEPGACDCPCEWCQQAAAEELVGLADRWADEQKERGRGCLN